MSKHSGLINQRLLPYLLTSLVAVMLSACSSGPQLTERPDLAYPAPPDEARFYFEQTIRGSTDIVQATEDDKMMYFLTGQGRVSAGFGKPFDIAAHKGRLFISDSANRDVFIVDKKQGIFDRLTAKSGERFSKPMGVATDAAGNLYMVDITKKTVNVFNRDGVFLYKIIGETFFERPSGIEVNPEGTLAFVVNVGGVDSDRHDITVLDLKTKQVIRTIGTRGSGDGQLNLPKDITLGIDGLLYIVDSGNFRVSVFTQEGVFVQSYGGIGTQLGTFSRPKGIATDPEGNAYVIDAGFGNFQIFNSEGQLLLFIGQRSAAGDRGQFMLPAGIEVDEDGRVYVVDQYLRKVDVFRPARLAKDQGYFSWPAAPTDKAATADPTIPAKPASQ